MLTERGRELARLAGGLARWGGPLRPPADEAGDHVINARWTLTHRVGRYRGGFPDGHVHVLLDQRDELTLSFTGNRAHLAYGHLSAEPIMVIEATTTAMLGLLRRLPEDSVDLDDEVSVAGRTDLLQPLLQALNA